MRTPRLGVFALALILPLLACGIADESMAHTSPETDRESLVALYNATGGPKWDGKYNWLSNIPIGEWLGVTTDDSGRVTELHLIYNHQMSGEIPSELGNLAKLTDLWLHHTRLSGEIPRELGNLTNLKARTIAKSLDGGIAELKGHLA